METTVAAVPVRTYPEKLHRGEATCSKCGQYAAKDDLRAAMDRVIREL